MTTTEILDAIELCSEGQRHSLNEQLSGEVVIGSLGQFSTVYNDSLTVLKDELLALEFEEFKNLAIEAITESYSFSIGGLPGGRRACGPKN